MTTKEWLEVLASMDDPAMSAIGEGLIARVRTLESRQVLMEAVISEAADVVRRTGRRPDGTAWADLNINHLADKVARLAALGQEAGK